ncbi:MAG: NUDIX domain-containing protein [Methylococcaceae bacterium]
MLDEVLQCFDDNGNPLDGQLRSEVKKEPFQFWCGVSKIWVVNTQGEILCSRRADHLMSGAGKWQSCFCGHVPLGISFLENAVKELGEESGIKVESSDLCFVERVKDEKYKKFFENFILLQDVHVDSLTFPDGEVSMARWMKVEEMSQEKNLLPDQWCNGCPENVVGAIEKMRRAYGEM